MFKKMLCLMSFIIVALSAHQWVQGDIVFNVDGGITDAGEIVAVTITARDEDGTPGNLTAYDLPLSIEGFGTDLSFAGFESSVFGAAAPVITPGVAPFNYDFQVTESDNTGVGVPIGATEVELVTINFLVSDSAPVGSMFDIGIITAPTPIASAYNFTGTDLGDESTSGTEAGVVEIQGVPEPSSLALGMLALCGFAVRRSRV